MVEFFEEAAVDESGKRRAREINTSLSAEFVVTLALDEHEDVEERIDATRWLGRREETYGLFCAVQLNHVASVTDRVRNNACINLLAGLMNGRSSLAHYLPAADGYRDRLFRTMSRVDFEDVDWTLRLVKFALDQPLDGETLDAAYERYLKHRSTYERQWQFPIPETMHLVKQAFKRLTSPDWPRE